MKRIFYSTFIVLTLLTVACQETKKEPEQVVTEMVNEIPEKVEIYKDIRTYVDGIDATIDSLAKRGPLTVNRGEDIMEVTVYVDEGTPLLIYAQNATENYQARYYLKNRKLVCLEEEGQEGSFYQREFYYEPDRVLASMEKKAKTYEELATKNFKDYNSEDAANDFRLHHVEAFKSAMAFLMGQ